MRIHYEREKEKTTHEWLDQLKKDLFREHQIGSNN